jgi:MFS family permease
MLCAANLMSMLDRTVLSLLVTPVKAALGLSDTQIGLLQGTAFGLFYTVMILPFGWLTDRVRRISLLSAGIALWSLMTAACGLAGSFVSLFIARMGVGIGEATLNPVGPSLISDHFPPARRSLPMAVYTLGGLLGGAFAIMAGGLLIAAVSRSGPTSLPLVGTLQPWQLVFFIVGLPGLGLALLCALLPEPARRENTSEAAPTADLAAALRARAPVFAPHFAGFTLFYVFGYAIVAWVPVYFTRVHDWSMSDVALRYGPVYLVASIVGSVGGGWLARARAQGGRADANLSIVAIGVGAMGAVAAVATIVPNAWLSLILIGLMIALFALPAGPSVAAIHDVTPNRLRGRVTAIYYACLGLVAITTGPLMIGLMNDHLFDSETAVGRSLALAGALLCPAGAILVAIAARRVRRDARV